MFDQVAAFSPPSSLFRMKTVCWQSPSGPLPFRLAPLRTIPSSVSSVRKRGVARTVYYSVVTGMHRSPLLKDQQKLTPQDVPLLEGVILTHLYSVRCTALGSRHNL